MSDRGTSKTGLVERSTELAAVDAAASGALSGGERIVLVEGSPGIGKTSILAELQRSAQRSGFRVLDARGTEMERDFGYGVVRHLLGPVVRGMPEAERERAFSGAAGLAASVFGLEGDELEVAAGEASLYGLLWLVLGLADDGPVLLSVDDAHWADSASLRFLDYLGHRLGDAPVLIALAARPNEPGAQAELLGEIVEELDPVRIRPGALSAEATATIVSERLGDAATPRLAGSVHEATGGNPFLIEELLADLRARAAEGAEIEPDAVSGMGPSRIAQSVTGRARRLGGDARAVVEAAAVLGDGTSLRMLATMTEVDPRRVAEIVDGLAAAAILADGSGVSFAHPLLRGAVHEAIPSASREAAHARAAEYLRAEGAGAEEIAAHLLLTEPGAGGAALDSLTDAAALAGRRGAPDSVIAYLRRALAEPMDDGRRSHLLQALGLAEGAVRDPAAVEHLEEAVALSEDPEQGIEATLLLASATAMAGDWGRNVAVVEQGIERFGGSGLASVPRMEAIRAANRGFDPDRIGEYDEHEARLLAMADGGSGPETRHLRWVLGSIGSIRDMPSERVLALIAPSRAGNSITDEDNWEDPVITQMAIALLVAEATDDARELAERLLTEGRRRGSLLAALNGTAYAGAVNSRSGDLDVAEADIRIAVDMVDAGGLGLVAVLAMLCFSVDAITEREGLEDVADLVLRTEIPPDFARTATGALLDELKGAIAMGRGERAVAIERLSAAGRTFERIGASPRVSAWRSRLAALTDPDRHEEALALVDEELAHARRLEDPRSIAVALRVRGGITRDAADLEESVAVLRDADQRLELSRSLAALGSALRRERRIGEARERLREALDLAQETGAERLEGRIFEELKVAGARPRRRDVSGAGSLTPAEHRVALAAAGGATNRNIAQDLFVSQRTVEMHLTNAYRKLGISSRAELTAALGA